MEEKPLVQLPAAKRLRRGRTMDEILISQALIILRNAGFHGQCPSFTVAATEESNTSSSAEENHDKPVETVTGAAEVENEERYSLISHLQSEDNSGDCSQPQEALDRYVIVHRVKIQTATDSEDGVTENSASHAENQDQVSPTTVPPAYNGSHCCCVCGKNFKSHQALGGHMTLHRIKPETATGSDGGGCSSIRVHECSVCHERFKSGQALGGHQRKHYGGPPLLRKRKIALPSRPILDLNLPPQPEE